jgi:hypothetical protein
VSIILKLLNVNAVAENVMKESYSGPTIAVADDPLLKDVKQPVKTDRMKLVRARVHQRGIYASDLATHIVAVAGGCIYDALA